MTLWPYLLLIAAGIVGAFVAWLHGEATGFREGYTCGYGEGFADGDDAPSQRGAA